MKFLSVFLIFACTVFDALADNSINTEPSHPLTSLYRDFILAEEPVVLEHPLANGKWRVTLVMGDEKFGHLDMRVEAEGNPVGPSFTSMIGQFLYVSRFGGSDTPAYFDVEVVDGSLSLKLFPSSRAGFRSWVLNRMSIEELSTFEDGDKDPKKEYHYDFGKPESPVQPGYQKISDADQGPFTFSTQVRSADRIVITGIFADLFLPLKFSYSGDRYGDREFQYRLYEPPDREKGVHYPLIVWLHGYDEGGNDNHAHLRWLREWFFDAEFLENNQFYLLAVQCPEDDMVWTHSNSEQPGRRLNDMGDVCKLIADKTIQDYPIDKDRVYLSGISSGGGGAWNIGGRFPHFFAAIMPLSSRGGDDDLVARLTTVPVWAFNNREDKQAPIEHVRRSVELLNSQGGNAHLTALEEKGHVARPYWHPQLKAAEWLLSKRRGDPGWWSRPGMPPWKHPPAKAQSRFAGRWPVLFALAVAASVLVWWRKSVTASST